jgi:phosphoribosylanthranilate isomerase
MTRIKICGNTEAAGVERAVSLKVDLLGFIFTRSKRQVSIEQAKALIAQVPNKIGKVGVFIDEPADQIAMIVEACGLTAVQIYREPTAADRALGVQLLPALRMRSESSPGLAGNSPSPLPDISLPLAGNSPSTLAGEGRDGGFPDFQDGDHPLLDTYVPDSVGGTGQSWDWAQAESVARRYPVIVSGGLNPDNVGRAIRQLKPWGVDVCSGVEQSPGAKDLDKLERFVRAVRRADVNPGEVGNR